jgi:hypothetical protein
MAAFLNTFEFFRFLRLLRVSKMLLVSFQEHGGPRPSYNSWRKWRAG